MNLAALGLAAALRIIQLVAAGDSSSRPATDVIDDAGMAHAAHGEGDAYSQVRNQTCIALGVMHQVAVST